MKENIISITVKLTTEDSWKGVKLMSRKQNSIFYGFMLSAAILDIILKEVSGLIIIILISIAHRVFSRLFYKKQFESRKLKESMYNFTETSIEVLTADGSSKTTIKWDELYGIKKNRDIVFLMTGSSTGYILPKRFFVDTEQFTNFEELISQKLDTKVIQNASYLKWGAVGVLLYMIITFLSLAINHYV